METLLLRLVFPPLTVLLAGWAQRRLGPRHSGRLVGLPLTSGPFLLVLLVAQGTADTVVAARAVLAGQLMVVAFTTLYAALAATSRRPVTVLVGVVPGVALLATATHAWLSHAAWQTSIVVAPLAVVALIRWRPETSDRVQPDTAELGTAPGGRELAGRAALTGSLVATLAASAETVGPSIAGLLASMPVVVSVVTPATHARDGIATARTMLRGTLAVVPGTAAFAAVIAATLNPLGPPAAFGLGIATMLLVNGTVDQLDHRTRHLAPAPRQQRTAPRQPLQWPAERRRRPSPRYRTVLRVAQQLANMLHITPAG